MSQPGISQPRTSASLVLSEIFHHPNKSSYLILSLNSADSTPPHLVPCHCMPTICVLIFYNLTRVLLKEQSSRTENLGSNTDWLKVMWPWEFIYPSKSVIEKEIATHSIILAWRIQWTDEPRELVFMRSQRVGHDRVAKHTQCIKILVLAFLCFHFCLGFETINLASSLLKSSHQIK